MSDFLSNFESDNDENKKGSLVNEETVNQEQKAKRRSPAITEEMEIDPSYTKKQRRKYTMTIVIGLGLMCLGVYGAYRITHVKMPDFSNKTLSDVTQWGVKNKLTIEPVQIFNLEKAANQIIEQPVKVGKYVAKGETLKFQVSKGANPDEVISLPDFKKLSEKEAESWLKEHQITNLRLQAEYDDKIKAGNFLSLELKEEAEEFQRKDAGVLRYSKGKEVYKKNIVVPDFKGKQKTEIEAWAKSNEIEIVYKDVPSEELDIGTVMGQSVAAKEKITKKSKMTLDVSAGKPIKVPDFSQLTPEEAGMMTKLTVLVKHHYSESVPYGQLISQSVASGEELTEKEASNITVVYSEGQPYLKDVTGETEGDLQKLFYDDYQSKGANIDYVVNYVNSEEKKGTVVSMSEFNTYVPLDYKVTVNVSLGY